MDKRLAKINEQQYLYRRRDEQDIYILPVKRVEDIYRKHFPHDGERNDAHILLAVDVEFSTSYEVGGQAEPESVQNE